MVDSISSITSDDVIRMEWLRRQSASFPRTLNSSGVCGCNSGLLHKRLDARVRGHDTIDPFRVVGEANEKRPTEVNLTSGALWGDTEYIAQKLAGQTKFLIFS